MKNEDAFNRFNKGLHQRSWNNLVKPQTSVQESHFLFQLEANLVTKKSVNFQFFARVFVHIFILGSCAIAKLQVFGNSSSNFI